MEDVKCPPSMCLMECQKVMNFYERWAQEKGKHVVQLDGVTNIFKMIQKGDVSWIKVIAGNAQNGMYEEPLRMVREMGTTNMKLDSFTLPSILLIFAEYMDA
ncbi:hypothetical protein DITRI_Ditri06bG0116500 [Diplodiscus trichospermus]